MKSAGSTINILLEGSSARTSSPKPDSFLAADPELAQKLHKAYQEQRTKLEELLGTRGDLPLTRQGSASIIGILDRVYQQKIDADGAFVECERILEAHDER